MAINLQRRRIEPQRMLGLRRGRPRNGTTLYLQQHPDELERIVTALRQIRAWGHEPLPDPHIQVPLDYDRR